MNYDNLSKETLIREIESLKEEIKRLQSLLTINNINFIKEEIPEFNFSLEEKIALYSEYFKGNPNYVVEQFEKNGNKFYSLVCENKFSSLCNIKEVKCKDCRNQKFVKYDDNIVLNQLKGTKQYGIYPLINDKCNFIVVDFDESNFKETAIAFKNNSLKYNVDVAIELSQSGNGAHAWIFFSEEIDAKIARKLCFYLLEDCFEEGKLDNLNSFDRLIPSQDYSPLNGFGNLIALPLSGKKSKNNNTTIFVRNDFTPFQLNEQFSYLKTINKLNKKEVESIIKNFDENKNKLLNLTNLKINNTDFNNDFTIYLNSMISVYKSQISKKALNFLKKIGSINNHEYFERQAKRLSTYNISRFLRLYHEDDVIIKLPIGVLNYLLEVFEKKKIKYRLKDSRTKGESIDITFNGELYEKQKEALDKLLNNERGILLTNTAFGKTVVAIALICALKINTAILVDKINLIEQWKQKIKEFTIFDENNKIGEYTSTKRKLSNFIDIISVKSLNSPDIDENIFENYGLVIIDEVHHLAAQSFENAIKKFNAKRIYGLTATLKRSDGNEGIIKKCIGDVIFEHFDEKSDFLRILHPIITGFNADLNSLTINGRVDYTSLLNEMIKDEKRNELILNRISENITKKNILVLTERIEHAQFLYEKIKEKYKDEYIYNINGSSSKKELKIFQEEINSLSLNKKITIISTGKFIGEGFDLDRLEVLYITMPIKWEGTLQQYTGRLHRQKEGKEKVEVYDFVDVNIPIFENMFNIRLKKYKKLLYKNEDNINEEFIFDKETYFKKLKEDLSNANSNIRFIIGLGYSKIINHLISFTSKNAKVYLYTNYEYEINREAKVLNLDKKSLINAIIIDDSIIYIGSLNPFVSNNSEDDSIIRVYDKLLIQKYINFIKI